MATLIVPPVLTSPKDDAIQLHRAFKGITPPSLSPYVILFKLCSFSISIEQLKYWLARIALDLI